MTGINGLGLRHRSLPDPVRSCVKKMRFGAVVTVLAALLATAWAQVGQPAENLVRSLGPYNLMQTGDGYTFGDGFTFSAEKRGDAVYSVTGAGNLSDANLPFAADLIGAATGYGEAIAAPVKTFFEERVGELAGQGPVALPVQEYLLTLEVTGGDPYDVRFTVARPEVPAALFPAATHTLGPADATYVIREFSDFQCPFCAKFTAEALPAIKKELLTRGDVRFEYHHFPLQSIHANALAAAEAAECVTAVNTPDAFWTYHDALFERQKAWEGLSDPASYFVRLAQDVGLSANGVEACLANRTFAAEVTKAYETAGGTLGLGGTPTVFVNGFKVGDYTKLSSYLDLMKLVDTFAEKTP